MSSIFATSSATAAAASSATDSASAGLISNKTLDQKDFLKLLITQMTSQDPMNPMSNENFMAQMAQFSTLQETQTMSGNITQLRSEQQVLQANSMLGKTVSLQVDDSTATSGVVSAVHINAEGTPQIIVDGAAYNLNQITTISSTVKSGS
jgi:flagellar basal-body rod modification protein FlgD